MSTAYRPPFDEDDELDRRGLYRNRGAGRGSPDAAGSPAWHAGPGWHPGWAAAACLALAAGMFAWTDALEERLANPPRPRAPIAAQPDPAAGAPPDAAAPPSARAAPPAPAEPAAAPPPASMPAAAPAGAQVPPQPAAGPAADAPPVTDAAPEAASDERIDELVGRIRGFMQNDQVEDAREALRELRELAPDYGLPDDLEELAGRQPA